MPSLSGNYKGIEGKCQCFLQWLKIRKGHFFLQGEISLKSKNSDALAMVGS